MATKKKIVYSSITILAICLIYGIAVSAFLNEKAERGLFGDMFGGLTALFSGLAFAGIIFSINQQKKEIQLQRKELQLTRDELKLTRREFELTRDEFKEQNKTLKKQRFENTFFNLLNYHTGLFKVLYFSADMGKVIGHDTFRNFYHLIHKRHNETFNDFKKNNNIDQNTPINMLGRVMMERRIIGINHYIFTAVESNYYMYFQSLRLIMKVIDSSDLLDTNSEKEFYAEIIKGQMTDYERTAILYYCLTANQNAKILGAYIKAYKIIDDLNEEYLISVQDKNIFNEWGAGSKN